jgi:hypothetical protein
LDAVIRAVAEFSDQGHDKFIGLQYCICDIVRVCRRLPLLSNRLLSTVPHAFAFDASRKFLPERFKSMWFVDY